MKTFKSIILIAILFIGGLTISGCDEDKSAKDENVNCGVAVGQAGLTKQVDKPLDTKAVLDTLNILVTRVDKMSSEIETYQIANTNNSSTIEKFKKKSSISIYISIVSAAIFLVIAIYALYKVNALTESSNRHRQDIEKLKRQLAEINNYMKKESKNKGTVTNNSSTEYRELSSRISKMERKLEPQQQPVSSISRIDNPTIASTKPLNEQYGYFGLPSKMSETEAYFKRTFKASDSEARFSVVIRDDKAEFSPLEGPQYLSDLKSSDAIKMALDIQGCAPSEATQMTVIKPGKAKLEDGRWIITKNAIITLSR